MPRETKSQIVDVTKPGKSNQEPVVVPVIGCKPHKPIKPPLIPGCYKQTEIEIMKNDIEKLKQAAQDSGDGESIELNDDQKLQIKDFDEASSGEIVMKSGDAAVWAKPELTVVHEEGDDEHDWCLAFTLNLERGNTDDNAG